MATEEVIKIKNLGKYVRNNSDNYIAVSEVNLLWQPRGASESVQFVPDEILYTSAPLQKLVHQKIQGTNKTKLEIVEPEDFNKEMEELEAEGGEFDHLLTTPQAEGVTFCAGLQMNGDSCNVYTSDPRIPRPYYCTEHEYQKKSPGASPDERETLVPPTRLGGPNVPSGRIEAQHIMHGKQDTIDSMSLESLEEQVKKLQEKERGLS